MRSIAEEMENMKKDVINPNIIVTSINVNGLNSLLWTMFPQKCVC